MERIAPSARLEAQLQELLGDDGFDLGGGDGAGRVGAVVEGQLDELDQGWPVEHQEHAQLVCTASERGWHARLFFFSLSAAKANSG